MESAPAFVQVPTGVSYFVESGVVDHGSDVLDVSGADSGAMARPRSCTARREQKQTYVPT